MPGVCAVAGRVEFYGCKPCRCGRREKYAWQDRKVTMSILDPFSAAIRRAIATATEAAAARPALPSSRSPLVEAACRTETRPEWRS